MNIWSLPTIKRKVINVQIRSTISNNILKCLYSKTLYPIFWSNRGRQTIMSQLRISENRILCRRCGKIRPARHQCKNQSRNIIGTWPWAFLFRIQSFFRLKDTWAKWEFGRKIVWSIVTNYSDVTEYYNCKIRPLLVRMTSFLKILKISL